MENCLVTKLKSSIDKNLPKLGYARITVKKSESLVLNERFIEFDFALRQSTIEIVGGTFLDSEGVSIGTTMTFGSYKKVYVSNDDAILYIDKRNLYGFRIDAVSANNFSFDLSDFYGYAYEISDVPIANGSYFQAVNNTCYGDIKVLSNNNHLANFILTGNANVVGDVNLIPHNVSSIGVSQTGITGIFNSENYANLISLNIAYTSIHVDLESLRNNQYLEVFYSRDNLNVSGVLADVFVPNIKQVDTYHNTNVTGTLEAAVERLWSSGKRDGRVQLGTSTTSVTFHNVNLRNFGDDFKIDYSNDGVTVKEYHTETLIGTYNGTSWTYNS